MSALDLGEAVALPTLSEFSLICRICLRRGDAGAMSLQPIHAYRDIHNASKGKQINLTDKINKCSDINVQHNYHLLPDNICSKCYNLLLIAHYFRTLAATSDNILRDILENVNEINLKREETVEVKVEVDVNGHHEDWDDYDSHQTVKEDPSPKYGLITSKDSLRPRDNKTRELYICDICQKLFHDKSLLSHHIQSHNGTLPSDVLNNAGNKRTPPKGKKSRINNTENTGLYECLVCDTSFTQQKYLTKHMSTHKKSTKYKCYGCAAVFDVYSERTQHEANNCPNMPPGTKYQCNSCKEKLDDRFLFDAHVNFRCIFNKARTQRDTIKLDPILKCTQCDYFTAKKIYLKNHILVNHTSEKPFVCEICGKGYCMVGKLNHHRKLSHLPRNETFKCELCPFETKTKSSIPKHMRQHTGETRYSCELCGKHFVYSSNYHVHVKRQHGDKDFQCDMCTKKFNVKRDLERHVSHVHFGHKLNVCQVCGVAFSKRASLSEHCLKVHKIKLPDSRRGRRAREEQAQEMVK